MTRFHPTDRPDNRDRTLEGAAMRALVLVLSVLVALTAFAGSMHVAHAQMAPPEPPAQGPISSVSAAQAQAAVPILNYLANDDVCDSWIEVQNVGTELTAVALVVWGEPGFCPAQAAGPLKVECTGLLKPGSTWSFVESQIPTGSKSGMLFSFSAKMLSDYGLDELFGFDDTISSLLCETAFFGVVGDADDWRRFKLAFDQGTVFAGIPMDLAHGEPIAAEVLRRCAGPDHPGQISSKYNALSGTRFGVYDPVYGGFANYAPIVYGNALGFESTLYVQNTGLSCSSVEVWFQGQDNCLRPYICEVVTLSPGETMQYNASDCVGPGWVGSAWLRTSQPVAVAIDQVAPGLLMSYSGLASQLHYAFEGAPYYTLGSAVAYGPLVYSEYQGWDTGIQVQNLSTTVAAKVKVYFFDRSGDIVTTLVDWVCPRGSQTFYLPAIATLPGNWVGSVRVESQEWATPGGPIVPATGIAAVAQLINYADVQHLSSNQAIAYNLLAEFDALDWKLGSGAGGRESGAAVLAVPSLLKDLEGFGVTSELAIANLVAKPGFTDFAVHIYDQNGYLDFVCETLGDKQVEYIDLQTWGYINPGFKGSAIISATYWEHEVFDPEGNFLRNLVGLGAVSIERVGTTLIQEIPGDQAAGSLAIPVAGDFAFMGLRAPMCPGMEDAPQIPDCPPQVIRHSGPLNLPLADLTTTSHTIDIPQIPAGCKVTDVDLDLALLHSDLGDLQARLVHTDRDDVATTNPLFSRICAGTDDIAATLDDDADTGIGSVCPPVGGRYTTTPRGGLDAFDGEEGAGGWTLQIDDLAAADAGLLLSWSITMTTIRQ
jgi:hypothetical protein